MKRTRNGLSYMGSKFKLFPWIFENLPEDIENMKALDVFGGGGSVTFSLSENYPNIDITYNDFSIYIYKAVKWINETPNKQIIKELEGYLRDDNVNMKKETALKSGLWLMEKEKFMFVRDNYINVKNPKAKWLYWYLISNINTAFRQSKKGYHNLSMGSNGVNYKKINTIKKYNNIDFRNDKFQDIDFNDYEFLYLDPPYFSTKENGNYTGTCDDFDDKLLNKLENYKGKFMMSNYDNEKYTNWAKENNFNIHYKENIKSITGKFVKSTEILIMNY